MFCNSNVGSVLIRSFFWLVRLYLSAHAVAFHGESNRIIPHSVSAQAYTCFVAKERAVVMVRKKKRKRREDHRRPKGAFISHHSSMKESSAVVSVCMRESERERERARENSPFSDDTDVILPGPTYFTLPPNFFTLPLHLSNFRLNNQT